MDVIFHTAYDDGWAVQSIENAANIFVHLISQRTVAQEWAALFGGEHEVQQNL
jgi:hypothetical protein